jgi:hypothetical protein
MTVPLNLDRADAEWVLETFTSLADAVEESLFYHGQQNPNGCVAGCHHEGEVAELTRAHRLVQLTRVALTSANPRVKAGS